MGVKLDKGTILEMLYDFRWNSMTVEEISDKYGIPESTVTKVVYYVR